MPESETAPPETSSEPPVLPRQQEDLFREVLTLCEKEKIPYAVAGAFAMQSHTGICRDTKDLDLFLTPQNAAHAFKHLRAAGFECEVCDPVWLFKIRRDDFFVDLITGMSNAAIVVDDSWIERAKSATVYGVPTRVLAAEEVLVSKVFIARRERFDGADFAHIVYGSKGKIDWQRALLLVGEHWEMLLWSLILFRYVYPAQTDYVPADIWNELLTRFKNVIASPDPDARFRGSLVDNKMFAIDVKEWGLPNLIEDYRDRRLRTLPESL